MVNEDYEPSPTEEDVLAVMRDEWRANPMLIREESGLGKGTINTALTRLTSAGWVRKVTRGLYEFVDDPRETDGVSEEETDAAWTKEDPIEAALEGWSYGRNADEKAANQAVAKQSLEWLRDEGGAEVKQADVPLDELAAVDPEGRKADSLWRTVVRGAWQHAAEQGYVGRPHSKAYTWGSEDAKEDDE